MRTSLGCDAETKDATMQFIESKVVFYRFLAQQLEKRTPKLFVDRPVIDWANAIVFVRLEQGLDATDIPECREYDPDTVEKAEVPEGVIRLSSAALRELRNGRHSDVVFGIVTLLEILKFSDRDYFETWPWRERVLIESTMKFQRKFDARVRVELLP